MKQDYVRAKNQCEQNHWGKGIYTQKKKKFNLTSRYPGLPSAQLVKNPPAMQETLVQFLG